MSPIRVGDRITIKDNSYSSNYMTLGRAYKVLAVRDDRVNVICDDGSTWVVMKTYIDKILKNSKDNPFKKSLVSIPRDTPPTPISKGYTFSSSPYYINWLS